MQGTLKDKWILKQQQVVPTKRDYYTRGFPTDYFLFHDHVNYFLAQNCYKKHCMLCVEFSAVKHCEVFSQTVTSHGICQTTRNTKKILSQLPPCLSCFLKPCWLLNNTTDCTETVFGHLKWKAWTIHGKSLQIQQCLFATKLNPNNHQLC